ncbi:hypothetical protein ACFV84_35245 [Kitasatospora sp. NPDC059811]|uniref:hypothetical protein n=1 Tax=Kitasatospora sp. NPDC059811 TaxID=3346957 RepID=UPI000A5B5A4E
MAVGARRTAFILLFAVAETPVNLTENATTTRHAEHKVAEHRSLGRAGAGR